MSIAYFHIVRTLWKRNNMPGSAQVSKTLCYITVYRNYTIDPVECVQIHILVELFILEVSIHHRSLIGYTFVPEKISPIIFEIYHMTNA